MTTHITDTERKLQTQINLLKATNEVLAERLAWVETERATELAAYEITVSNLTAERAELAAKVEKLELNNDPDALTIAYMSGVERGKERVKALEADAGRYRWIPTSEQMPEPQVNVFVRQNDGKVGVCSWWGADYKFDVTHWMPLPPAPTDAAMKGTP